MHRASSHTLRGKRVLVVDDISTNRLIAGRFLRALHATVDFAEDGEAGVAAVKTAEPPFDLVLMDCHMPKMDGYEAAGAIRSLPDAARARVPIVAISASAQPSDVARSRAAGMDAHVAKPIDSEALASCVIRWVTVARS
jgi:CheY-like chemotaxis protein